MPFEVVPGVSAVSAVPAYAGVPLTTKASRAVHVITPHDTKVDWSRSTGDDVTVVIMGEPPVVTAPWPTCWPLDGPRRRPSR